MKEKSLFILLFTLFSLGIAQQPGTLNVFTSVDPPSLYRDSTVLGKTQSVIFLPSYENRSDSLISFPGEVQNVVEKALGIWSFLLGSSQTIKVHIIWEKKDSETFLAACGPQSYLMNFTYAPKPNVFYPVALAEKISRSDLNPVDSTDIELTINARYHAEFYYGVDGKTPANKYDLETVILHEIAH